MNETDLAFASIATIGELFRKRELSPVELTELMLSRIARFNPQLNAYITVIADGARAQAKKAEAELCAGRIRKARLDRGLLHGIPISLKDNIYTAGVRTTAGSRILYKFIPDQDAPLVTQLKQAGAVILAKTNMHEFAYGVTSNNPHYGPVKNPWDRTRIPGGSSGGSAAAVAAGLCYGSIGTDTGGSIRIPAALCGVVGLKTTLHRVNEECVIPLSPSLDCIGPLARTVDDAAILLQTIFKADNTKTPHARGRKLGRRFAKVRLGLPRELISDAISDEARKPFEAALRDLRRLGAEITDASIPLLQETELAGNRLAWAEATRFHQRSGWFPGRASEYGEDVRSRLEAGIKVSATEYLEALEVRDKFVQQLRGTMESQGIDALVLPTTPIAAPLIGEETTRVGKIDLPTRALLLRLNRPANLAGVPAISVPCGFTPDGLPVGLQLIGPANTESQLLQIASVYEHAHPVSLPPDLGA